MEKSRQLIECTEWSISHPSHQSKNQCKEKGQAMNNPQGMVDDSRKAMFKGMRIDRQITIGAYTLTPFGDGSVSWWIEHESGEGMQTSTEKLEKCIEEFYNKNF
jgi:hypothetical protein